MAHSSLAWDRYLNPQETQAYGQLFKLASQSKNGIVTGSEAVQFFASSGVPNEILSDIWETADRDNVGYLTPETFSIALKLIACAQHGQEVADPIISTVVALPQFKGIQTDIAGVTSPRINNSNNNYDPANTITPAEREKYYNIFRAHQPTNGVLDASRARNVFLKSKLPTETLGQIWALADVRQAGTLTQAEFAIAMHYIAKLMDGTLTTLPGQLPSSVYSSASGPAATPMLSHQQSPVIRQMSGNTTPMIQQQFTGNRMIMTPPQRAATIDTLGNMAFSGSSEVIPRHWDVTATEKTQYDTFFDKIDSQRNGFVQGKEAVEFFKNSQLPDGDLAHIWDLADTSQRGRLSRNEFAVAMHLIHKRLRGDTLPPTLPSSLVPPSPLPPAPSAPVGMVSSPVNINRSINPTPARSFSNDIFNQPTKVTSLIDEDLLGDFGNNDQLTQETNQVNQLQNQITSLKSATVDVKNQKLTAEQTLEQLAKQKQELQAQMTQVRMAHEAQVKDLNELQEAIRVEEPEWNQARSDFEAAQQQLTAVQQEIQQLRQKLDTSRAESEECRRRVHQIQEETAALEAQIDGLNGQVKQQNMMLDINRRQVTASEQDREQARRNLQDAKEVRGITESARDLDLNSAPTTTPPRKSTTDFSLDNNDDSSSDDDDDNNNKSNVSQTASSPFGVFTPSSPSSGTPTGNSFFDIFSPHQEQAELQATTAQTGGNDPVDFDAVFGDLAGIPSSEENNNSDDVTPFDTAATSSPFDPQQGSGTPFSPESAKKHRAPPPPPPPPAKATPQLAEGDDDDDFDTAFSGPLPEAKVAGQDSKAATHSSDFDDFDDAFGVFDDSKDNKATTTNQNTSWPSQFDITTKSDQQPTQQKTTSTDATDDWDSIFGGNFTTTSSSSPQVTQGNNNAGFGFEDAFGSTPFETTPDKGKSPANNNKVFTETSIVGDGNKVDELVKMGFEKQVAKDALERYDQDLAKATNFLLDQTN
ncbi:hypothetical protein BC941DRAFT_466189 [Chlamydoabsidia padenii]|nr:hypothetical protein BC941DRAFT_466189 [Chlamydoabsidia padenii]